MPVFAVSERMTSGFWSFYHRRAFCFDVLSRALVSMQHVLYYPVMAVAKVNLYVQTHLFLLQSSVRTSWLECAGMLAHYAWVAAMATSLPTTTSAVAFVATAVAVAGVLHVQITLSHFPMATHEVRAPGGGKGLASPEGGHPAHPLSAAHPPPLPCRLGWERRGSAIATEKSRGGTCSSKAPWMWPARRPWTGSTGGFSTRQCTTSFRAFRARRSGTRRGA